jgi:MFS family permease
MTRSSHPIPASPRIPAPLTIPAFRWYVLARLTSTLAQFAMILIIGWQVYSIARETMGIERAALQLGLIGLFQFLPLFFLTPLVGWVADHVDRRNVARATVALQALVASALAFFTWAEAVTLPILFTVAVLLGIARAFSGPALSALAPNLVPKAVLPNAIALSSIAWQSGMIIGPAIGGYSYAWYPPAAYIASAALFVAAIVFLSLINGVERSPIDKSRHPLRQTVEGVRYVWHNKLILGAITLDLFAVLLAGATALLPIYARDILEVGTTGLSQLAAAPAAGAALTALYFSFRPLKTEVGAKMLVAVAVFGAATIVFGFSTWMPLSLAALFVAGAADMFSVYIRQSLIQLHTPDEKRGRVSAVSLLTISASNELGDAESGFVAALIGPVAAVVAGGVGAILVVMIWARRFPELRLARTFEPPDMPGAPQQETAR